jgi:hypothetical protein
MRILGVCCSHGPVGPFRAIMRVSLRPATDLWLQGKERAR